MPVFSYRRQAVDRLDGMISAVDRAREYFIAELFRLQRARAAVDRAESLWDQPAAASLTDEVLNASVAGCLSVTETVAAAACGHTPTAGRSGSAT